MLRNISQAMLSSQQAIVSAVRWHVGPLEQVALGHHLTRSLIWSASPLADSTTKEDKTGSEAEPTAAAAETDVKSEEAEENMDVEALKAELEQKSAQLDESQAQLADVKDRAIRVMADMENLRARTTQQIDESKQFAIQGFAKSILEISDNLQRALASVPAPMVDDVSDPSTLDAQAVHTNLKNLYSGVALSEKVMLKVFRDNGLERIETEVGGAFDPNLHNALFEVPTADIEPGAIAAVTKTGYVLNGRVIRAADVGVAKAAE